jgi:shikimate dehydrogenase
MHKHILSELNQENFTYQMLSLNSEEAEKFFKKLPYMAINATIPYKDYLFLASKKQSEASKICKCSNYLLNGMAYTTDGQGLLLALKYQGLSVSGKGVLVYGMGGAGRSIALALKAAGATVFIENRTHSKAVEFCENADGFSLYNGENCDILINATSNVTDVLFDKQKINQKVAVVDINYNQPSALLEYAKQLGATACDGKDMLFFQAYICDCILSNCAIDEEIAFNLYNKYKVKYEN